MQAAIFAALSGEVTHGAAEVAVWDHYPTAADLPLIQIGDIDGTDFSTKTGLGWELDATVHCWTDGRARSTTRAIQSQIENLLDSRRATATALAPAGFTVTLIHQVYVSVTPEPDGVSMHGVQRFRALLEEN